MLKISHSIDNNNTSHVVAKQTESYIIFTVDNEEIGVEAQKVVELVQYMAPLKMPNKFINVDGMAIYRGRMIPIIDLRLIFGLEPIDYDDNTVTIVVESSVSTFGITAERVLDLIFIPATSIKKVSALNFGEKTEYLKSVANFSERLVLLLDLDKMIETKPDKSAFEGPVQPESFIKMDTESSCLIDPKELEDLLNKGLPESEQEKEASSAKELTEEDSQPVTLDILKAEEIAEVLSNLESDGVMDLPEDLFKIETSVEIQMDPDQREEQLSNEVIERILKELEFESEPNSKGQSSESDRKI